MRDQDDGDPHDLRLSAKHFPRASMVDNLVMSLDQFAPGTEPSRNNAPWPGTNRPKGHTKSSSITVDSELTARTLRENPIIEVRGPKEGFKIEQVESVPNIFGEEEETQRDKAYNAQRAMQSGKTSSARVNGKVKSRSDSNSSSIDLGHLSSYVGRLGAPGNRRSQSFDFGSTRPKLVSDSVDTAPAATILPSSDVVSNTTGSGSATNNVARRNSGRSAKGNHSRKGRSGTISASTGKPRLDSPQPQQSTKSQTFDVGDGKSVTSVQPDQTHVPRAGFFRRVFGSSNKSSMGPSSYPSPNRLSQDRTGSALELRRPPTPPGKSSRQVLTDQSHNKENQPAISKKPSSFFRRRKKSISGGVPPPLPLTLNGNIENTKPETGQSSPVSSLRAFMDPYLGDGVPKHVRGSSLQSVHPAPEHVRKAKLIENPIETKIESGVLGAKEPPETPNARPSALTDKGKNDVRLDPRNTESNSPSTPKALASNLPPTSSTRVDAENPSIIQNSSLSNQSPVKQNIRGQTSQAREQTSPVKTKMSNDFQGQDTYAPMAMIKLVPQSSGSDISEYKSAPSTPLVAEMPERATIRSPTVHVSHPSISQRFTDVDIEQAQKIFDNSDEQVNSANAAGWLGEANSEREQIRLAYMSLFNWTNSSILAALRNLCSKLVLKAETQQVDRVLDAFAKRWCECNPNHGFKSTDIVHTICYSILLLNTDLHLADIGKKMTRAEFVRNAVDTIRENMPAHDIKPNESASLLAVRTNSRTSAAPSLRPSTDRSASSLSTTRPTEQLIREESYDEGDDGGLAVRLVNTPFVGSRNGWELQIESVLKEFYSSISKEPLPLFGSPQNTKSTPQQSMNNLSTFSTLRRTPSTISKSTSETRGRFMGESRSLGARWSSKTRSRPRIGSAQAFGSSRTSFDDQSSAWSPSMSSTWSKVSLGKTLTTMSVESFGTDHLSGGYQSSIGFANALSQAIIRDEHMDHDIDDGIKAAPLLEDESLELYGAPWAKEGILKHKCHLEGVDKRSKDRNWNDCFAVIEKGWMRLFSFSMTAKSLRNKARNHKAGAVVGGGNWQDNAEEVWKFMLRHTIASSLPPPGYSKQRPYVWALSLPNGAVHLFSVGTPDIVKEFVSTANFWSARLSKEPMTGGVSSTEYGWSDNVINKALITSDSHAGFNNTSSPRPSTQLSMRNSIDHGNARPRLPGDKVHVSEWVPPQQSLMASQLMEIDQQKALQTYVKHIEDELQKHNELRSPMLLAFSARHPNSQKAMSNWEKKSSYLLREIVKFRTYIDALQSAQSTKEKVDKMRKEEEVGKRAEVETRAVAVAVN